ncbi:MAG: hypothetical protein QOI27_1288 [Gaiellaceae bacterium]|nr:hypothetical protein [Gaiellaceae bacterium]
MKVVLTLLVRNEADIVDSNIAYHLSRGVDFIIATDNNSDDGTLDILEEYERIGRLQLIREPGENYAQSDWVSRMAHLAATEHAADWTIHVDADEFWWPRHGMLKDIFASVPEKYGVFQAHRLDFLPRPNEDGFFAERMSVRRRMPDKVKVAHRPDPEVVVGQGSHRLDRTSLASAPPWYGVDVLHFPLRSYAQFEQKVRIAGSSTGVKHWRNAHQLLELDQLRSGWDALLLDDEAVASIVAGTQPEPTDVLVGRSGKRSLGGLVHDCRLRDYLRELRVDPAATGERLPISPTGFSLQPPPAHEPQLDPEVAVAMDIVERNLDEAIKTYVRDAKEQLREVMRTRDTAKTRVGNLKRENVQLREEIAAAKAHIATLEQRQSEPRRSLWSRKAT